MYTLDTYPCPNENQTFYFHGNSLKLPRKLLTSMELTEGTSKLPLKFPWKFHGTETLSFRSCTYTPFLPQGLKLSLFLLYGQWFPRYGPIFKIAIFGHETWPLAKVPEVAHIGSFYPRGSKLSLFLLYGQRFLIYRPIFKLPYSGMKFGHWPKYQKLYI